MNTLPSMDRHIQQTNDRLQCIKQVCIKIHVSRPFNFFQCCERWILEAKKQESAFPFISYTLFSAQYLIWTSVFLAISSSHTDHVAQGQRERDREREIWQWTQEETSKRRAAFPLPSPVLTYITFLTLDVRMLALVVVLLKGFPDCQLAGDSFRHIYG